MKRFEEKEIEILMLDRCTRTEAEKHLKNGTIIYSDLEEHLEEYLDGWNIEEEEREPFREMIKTGVPARGWGVVKKGDKTYYIEYCL